MDKMFYINTDPMGFREMHGAPCSLLFLNPRNNMVYAACWTNIHGEDPIWPSFSRRPVPGPSSPSSWEACSRGCQVHFAAKASGNINPTTWTSFRHWNAKVDSGVCRRSSYPARTRLSSLVHTGDRRAARTYATFGNVPSAGGRHAFETYLQINLVSGLEPGIYRYLAFSHRLMPIEIRPGMADRVMEACLRQAIVKDSAVTFIWSCVIYRMAWRYSERAYRLVHLDAGHVCQNLYLAAEHINCGLVLLEPSMTAYACIAWDWWCGGVRHLLCNCWEEAFMCAV